MRNTKLLFILVLILTSNSLTAQLHKPFLIQVVDNASILNNKVVYLISPDSVVINAIGDYGRSPVRYHQRKLTNSESKSLSKFVKSFPLDSLDDLYKSDFNPVDYEENELYPRIMEISVSTGYRSHYYKTINCWVRYSEMLIKAINPLIPEEVRIKYDKANFNAFY